jgi:hypothetical protein
VVSILILFMRATSSSTARAKRHRGATGSRSTCVLTNELIINESTTLCAACSHSIPTRANRVRLMPCTHLLCMFCVLKSHADRGCKCHKCPVSDCKRPTSSNKYIYADSAETKTLNTRVADDVLKNNAPVQWLVKKYRDKVVAGKQDGGYQAVALSCTKLELNESGKLGTKTVTSTLLLKRIKVKSKTVYEVEDHMQGLIEVGDFFSFLYHPIVCTSNTLSKDLPVLSPREMLLMRCRHSRLLDRALWALGTGKNNFDHEFFLKPDNQDYQKYFMAAIISSDILLRNSRDSPGYFQLMMDEILIRQRTTKEFKAF